MPVKTRRESYEKQRRSLWTQRKCLVCVPLLAYTVPAFYLGLRLIDLLCLENPEEFFEYNFGYDVVKESQEILLRECGGSL